MVKFPYNRNHLTLQKIFSEIFQKVVFFIFLFSNFYPSMYFRFKTNIL